MLEINEYQNQFRSPNQMQKHAKLQQLKKNDALANSFDSRVSS